MKAVFAGLMVMVLSLAAQASVTLQLVKEGKDDTYVHIEIRSIEVRPEGVVIDALKEVALGKPRKEETYIVYQASIEKLGVSSLELANLLRNYGVAGQHMTLKGSAFSSKGIIYLSDIAVRM